MGKFMGSEEPEEALIFVYGTLKRGFPNHYLIEDLIRSNDAVPIPSTFQTLLPFPLVVGPLSIPYLLNLPGSGHRVRGELYSVSPRGLARLDELEGVSYGHYERLSVQVELSSSRDVAPAEAYFGHRSFAEEMWRTCGKAAVEEYKEADAAGYVKPDDRPDGFNFLENIRHYLASDDRIGSDSDLLLPMATSSEHTASIIDGKAIAQTIRSEIADEIRDMSQKFGRVPGLAVVIVGTRKDSQSYVNMKRKACAEVGIKSFHIELPEQVSEAELIAKVHELNANPEVHGILVQLPLPKHINEEKILSEIVIEKDVDGFHPLNIGKLAMKGRDPLFQPCTPKGCLELLTRSGISVKGKKAVVVGRSNIVGLPVSLLLLKADATVSVVHSCTSEPEKLIREADIVIAAAGQAMMIKGDWIKPGAAVIDVGTNAVDDPTKKAGYRMVGDVHFEEVCKVAGWITPVPGGVGPMTVAMLLRNTVDGAKRVIEN